METNSNKYESYDDYPAYNGNDLEYIYTPEQTTFKLWSPEAESAILRIYENGNSGEAVETINMQFVDNSIWHSTINKNLKGYFYTFQIKNNDEWLPEAVGIYAKAIGVNGIRGAVIDLNDTNPTDWHNDKKPELINHSDSSIYEIHVRDFSMADNSGMKNKGKFLAFTEQGTTNSFGQKTGIDHLQELGITHVHVLPFYDFATIDETKLELNRYNWGYDPANYNVPEGSYSTNPYDPICRIKELKQMIQALHSKGIRVIMDCVYNHVYKVEDSNFEKLIPGYFFRQNADGSFSNASGCGNETASERPMVRRFIVDSIKYWANEYHIDGFRFDLMAIHDVDTMNEIRSELNKIDPSIIMYGEGWTAGDSPLAYEHRAVKQHISRMPGIGVFSDDLRDALKGKWSNARENAFACGAQGYDETIKFGSVAATYHNNIHYGLINYSNAPYADSPSQVINYVSCHDDLCLNDAFSNSAPYGSSPQELLKYNLLAQGIVLTAQGIPFIYAGEELLRTKKGVHNTYQSPDSINEINWDFKHKNFAAFQFYSGLIKLRRKHPAFRMPTTQMIQDNLHFITTNQACVVAYTLINNANGDSWNKILVAYNGNRHNATINIPKENWVVACNGQQINENGIFNFNKPDLTIPASSLMILFKK